MRIPPPASGQMPRRMRVNAENGGFWWRRLGKVLAYSSRVKRYVVKSGSVAIR